MSIAYSNMHYCFEKFNPSGIICFYVKIQSTKNSREKQNLSFEYSIKAIVKNSFETQYCMNAIIVP